MDPRLRRGRSLDFDETIDGAYIKTSLSRALVRPGPAIGQDNDHVFCELLGIPAARCRELIEARVIF